MAFIAESVMAVASEGARPADTFVKEPAASNSVEPKPLLTIARPTEPSSSGSSAIRSSRSSAVVVAPATRHGLQASTSTHTPVRRPRPPRERSPRSVPPS